MAQQKPEWEVRMDRIDATLERTAQLQEEFREEFNREARFLVDYGEPRSLDHETGKIRWIQTDVIGSERARSVVQLEACSSGLGRSLACLQEAWPHLTKEDVSRPQSVWLESRVHWATG